MQFTIKKAILKKDGVEIQYTKTDDKGAKSVCVETFKAPIHNDLKLVVDSLSIHLATMPGFIKSSQISDFSAPNTELIEGFHATGFILGGGDDNPGVQITGNKVCETGPPFNYNTPFRRFTEGEASRYIGMDDLISKLDRMDNELRAFMDGSKRGDDPQLNMFDQPKENVTKEQIATIRGDGSGQTVKILPADKEAQQRVKEGFEEAEVVEDKQKSSGRKKRVKQTPENPGGIVEEPEQN